MLKNVRLYWLAGCFALTIFVSAFLVFQVQPVISKTILPWFGGAPAVWTTCMLFFQVLLFLGYENEVRALGLMYPMVYLILCVGMLRIYGDPTPKNPVP